MWVTSHELYHAVAFGADGVEHIRGTSRRGYSPKMATLQRSYDDVIQLFGKSGRIFCPMISGGGARKLFEDEPALKNDARFKLYPEWIQEQVSVAQRCFAGQDPQGQPSNDGVLGFQVDGQSLQGTVFVVGQILKECGKEAFGEKESLEGKGILPLSISEGWHEIRQSKGLCESDY